MQMGRRGKTKRENFGEEKEINTPMWVKCQPQIRKKKKKQKKKGTGAPACSHETDYYLFERFSFLTSQPEVKQRIADAVNDNQEPVAVTTAIQEEIFVEMGLDPRFGLACLGKVNMDYENDQDLMIRFYGFVAKEEMACEEAELGPDGYAERLQMQQELHEQQLEMLKHMRNFHMDDQSAVLEKLRQQMEASNFESEASLLSLDQIHNIVRRNVSPVFRPT